MLASILVSAALVVGLQTQSTTPTTKPAQGTPTTRQTAPAAKPAAASTSTVQARAKSIPATAVAAGNFNTLVTALQAADLVTALEGTGPFTVFAPTDEAFAKLPKGTVESLLQPENKAKLVEILTYHVVPGRIYSDEVVAVTEAPTVLGRNLPIAAANGVVTVGGAKVVAVDIEASNGVIHVVDAVILPGAASGSAADAPKATKPGTASN